ncbi:MAG: sulfite exporter TauE/SafE family protein [Planctomycetes bacterium]|nr:sulfite exporter TauE/SafE family protein [Planctomycetota bacterium]
MVGPVPRPSGLQLAIGFVTNFFDTLGIGNFAPTTAVFRFTRMVPDEKIPGTMNAGHALPVVTEAFIYIAIIQVLPGTLALMIAAAVAGAWLGAGLVAMLPRHRVQLGMGLALVAAAALMVMGQFDAFPLGGEALGLEGARLAIGVAGVALLGALMTIGVGLYAPCLILISFLGMDPKAAFPVMMGACAFLMPVASARFIRRGSYSPRPAVGLTLGGIPGVLVAAFLVTSMSLTAVRWVVVVVVAFTAATMLRAALRPPVPAP